MKIITKILWKGTQRSHNVMAPFGQFLDIANAADPLDVEPLPIKLPQKGSIMFKGSFRVYFLGGIGSATDIVK